MRRLLYWWHLVNKNKDSMLFKVYDAQKLDSVKDDWINFLNLDKKEFDIDLDDEKLIDLFKTKNSFKNFIKKKGKQVAIKHLMELKNKHSKLDEMVFTELNCSPYLENQSISQREAKLLFKLRSRMYQVKCNFKGLYGTLWEQPHM